MAVPEGSVLPPGTFLFEFKGIALHGFASDSTDDVQWRIAIHEFDRRAGAQTENMGRAPWQQRVNLLWVDEDGFSRATGFMLSLERDPSGLLVHPIYGKRQATCLGAQGARLTSHEANTYTMPVTFVEDSLDASVVGADGQAAGAQAAAVTSQAATLLAMATHYSVAATAVQNVANAATSLAVAATANAESVAINSTPLGTLLAQMPALTQAAIVAMRLENVAPEVADDVRNCEVLLYACAQLGDAVIGQHPALSDYRVTIDTPLMALAGRLYGADGSNRLAELLANNPAIVGKPAIPAGTVLKVASS